MTGIDFQRRPDQRQRLFIAALLQAQNSQQMARDEGRKIAFQGLLVELGGFVPLALLVQPDRLIAEGLLGSCVSLAARASQ